MSYKLTFKDLKELADDINNFSLMNYQVNVTTSYNRYNVEKVINGKVQKNLVCRVSCREAYYFLLGMYGGLNGVQKASWNRIIVTWDMDDIINEFKYLKIEYNEIDLDYIFNKLGKYVPEISVDLIDQLILEYKGAQDDKV